MEVCSRIERPSIARVQSGRHREPRLEEYAEGEKPHGEVRISLHSTPRASNGPGIPLGSLGKILGENFMTAVIWDAGK